VLDLIVNAGPIGKWWKIGIGGPTGGDIACSAHGTWFELSSEPG